MAGNPNATLSPVAPSGCVPGTSSPLPDAPLGIPGSSDSCSNPGGGGGLPDPGNGSCPSPQPTSKSYWGIGCNGKGTLRAGNARQRFTQTWAESGQSPDPGWCLTYKSYSDAFAIPGVLDPGFVQGTFSVVVQYNSGAPTPPPPAIVVRVTSYVRSDSIGQYPQPNVSFDASNGFGDAPVKTVDPWQGDPTMAYYALISQGTHDVPIQIGSDGSGRYDFSVSCTISSPYTQNGCVAEFVFEVVENP